MTTTATATITAFAGQDLIDTGAAATVALAARTRHHETPDATILIFDDQTGGLVDLDLRGDADSVRAQLSDHPALTPVAAATVPAAETPDADAPPRRGRPRLGVVGREISLLPRHWDWLNSQPKSASATLRGLVEARMKTGAARDRLRAQQAKTYRVMSALGGDLPDFEEASRALFAQDHRLLAEIMTPWPADIAAYILRLAA